MRKRRSVPEMVEDREVMKQRVLDSQLCKCREAFTSADVAKLLKKTTSCASQYLRQMVNEKRLSGKLVGGRMFYLPAQPKIQSISWRVDESVYAELEEALCDL